MPHGKGMLLATLRPAEEIRSDKPYFAEIATAPLGRRMVMLAQRLVEQRVGKLDLREFAEDRYQAALHELIKCKMKGQPPTAPTPARPPGNVVNLMDALKRSVAAGRRKPATPGKRTTAHSQADPARASADDGRRLLPAPAVPCW